MLTESREYGLLNIEGVLAKRLVDKGQAPNTRGLLPLDENEEHLGEELPGIVTGVSPNGGIHVSLDRFLVDGLARSSDITAGSGREDRWDRDERSGRLVARRSGASVGLGDAVKVRILRSDPAPQRFFWSGSAMLVWLH